MRRIIDFLALAAIVWASYAPPADAQAPVVPYLHNPTAGKLPYPVDATHPLPIICESGCAGSGGTSSTFGAAVPTVGTAVGASDGTDMQPLLVDGSGYLKVNVVTGGGGGVADQSAFTQGSSNIVPIGCLFISAYSSITTGEAGVLQCDNKGHPVVVGTGTFAVQATLQASGSTAIGKVDPNTIATWGLMSGTTPGTAPTNTQIMGGIYNSSPPGPTTGQTLPFQLDSAGNLNVNIKAGAGSGGTALADGATFTEASTSFTPVGGEYVSGGGASCTTGKGCTVQMTIDRMAYVNIGKVGGAATGTAGSAGTGVLTVQGITSMTPIQVSQATSSNLKGQVDPLTISTWGIATVGVGSAPTNMQVGGAVYNSGGVTPSNGQSVALQTDSSGFLKVNVAAGGGSGGTSSSFGSAFPSTGTAIGLTDGTNMVAWSATSNYGTAPSAIAVPAVNAYVTNSNANGSAVSASSSPVVIASDQAAVAVKAASAAFASGSIASGALASGSIASGAMVDLLTVIGTKAAGTAAADSLLGGVVYNSTLPSPTNGQQTAAQADNQGRAIAAPGSILSHTLVKGTTAAMTGTSSVQLIAAVSSQHIYPTHISCNNSSSTATLVSIQDGSAGTTLMTLIAPAGGGDTESDIDALTWTTAGNGLYAADVTTGASVICNASGHSSVN